MRDDNWAQEQSGWGGTSKGEGMEESGNGIEPRQRYKQYYYNQN